MAHTLTKRMRKALPWLPAMAIVGMGAMSAVGLQAIPGAIAASGASPQTGTTNITATVSPEAHITPCGAIAMGSVMPAADDTAGGTCSSTFGTNNGSTAMLAIHDSNAGSPALCVRATPTGACGTGSFADGWASASDMPEGSFGIDPTEGAPTANCTIQAGFATAGNKYAVPDTATNICAANALPTDGTFQFTAYWDPASSQTSSTSYQGQLTLTVTST